MKPTKSIALCTYNGEKYLLSQLESYLAQTCLPDEVVVCDDCSQDGTGAILNGFAARAPFPVRILVNDRNIGSTKNFEKAITLCSGDIIFLSDQDDVWAPNKIDRVFKEFDRDDNVGMVFTDAELVDETLQPLGRNLLDGRLTREEKALIEKGDLFAIMFERNIVTGATLAFRARYRNAFIPISTDIPNMYHDEWIAVILSVISKSIFLDAPLIKYRQHEKQQIGMSFAADVVTDVVTDVTIVSKLAWNNVMENVVRKHTSKIESLEWRKTYFTSKIDIPEHIINALNAEIQYQQKYVHHYRIRKQLPDNHLRRLGPVLRELLRGRYHRFSSGIRSAARDFAVNHAKEFEYHEVIEECAN